MNLEDLMHVQPNGGDQKKESDSPLKSLQEDFILYNETIKEVALEIMSEELSDYPIFIAHQHEVSVGELLLDHHDLGTSWTINASTLEEFISHDLIKPEKKEGFIAKYKDPEMYCCLFVIVPEGANFVFIPYK